MERLTPRETTMGHGFAEIAFTPGVQGVQEQMGSRRGYARLLGGPAHHHRLGPNEAAFIGARDSFYIASVGATGWPYIQHRGGPKGFLRVLDDATIGFADFSGNRQYVSVGNIAGDDRVSLFLMDYPNRTRLKILGHARQIGLEDPALERLIIPGYSARVERGLLIAIAAFDWNCPQHITRAIQSKRSRRRTPRAAEAETQSRSM
jgi:predicted pyridoxine 5'-phosphate oxidase superfamily flavin-nucleotide-binding protein